MTVIYNGKYSRQVKQALYIYDYISSYWKNIYKGTGSTSDATVSKTIISPTHYISTTGYIGLRVSSSGSLLSYRCYGDYMMFIIETYGQNITP
jgi:hypothetical protein